MDEPTPADAARSLPYLQELERVPSGHSLLDPTARLSQHPRRASGPGRGLANASSRRVRGCAMAAPAARTATKSGPVSCPAGTLTSTREDSNGAHPAHGPGDR
jgi:hypothetical protein